VNTAQETAPPPAEGRARLSAAEHVRTLSRTQRLVAGYGAAFVAVASFVRFGFSGHALVGAIFAAALVLLTVIDLDRRLIPDTIVLPTLAVVLILQIAFHPNHTLEWVIATVGAALFFFIPMVVYPAGMGLGDVKLAALLGAALGRSVTVAIAAALFAAGAVALYVLLREGAAARKKAIAFGPFLAFGGLLVLFLGGH
jgi:leader peptidase (prepilin peptidase) / N-methyltransferase